MQSAHFCEWHIISVQYILVIKNMKMVLMKGRQGRLYSPYLRDRDTGAQRGYLAQVQVFRGEDTKSRSESITYALGTSLGLLTRSQTVGICPQKMGTYPRPFHTTPLSLTSWGNHRS